MRVRRRAKVEVPSCILESNDAFDGPSSEGVRPAQRQALEPVFTVVNGARPKLLLEAGEAVRGPGLAEVKSAAARLAGVLDRLPLKEGVGAGVADPLLVQRSARVVGVASAQHDACRYRRAVFASDPDPHGFPKGVGQLLELLKRVAALSPPAR